MKKLLSVVLAAIMTVSVFALSAVPVMADTVNSPTATTAAPKAPTLMVNGIVTEFGISYAASNSVPNVVVFTYEDEGTVVGWEHNLDALGLAEDTDYTAVQNEDGTLTITFITEEANDEWENGNVIVNAIVEFDNGATTTTKVAGTTKKNDSSKAPATGMSTSVIAGSVAVACAGIAVLAATKKKDAE